MSSLYELRSLPLSRLVFFQSIKLFMSKRENQTATLEIRRQNSISALRDAAAGCKACDLWKLGTQTVFGEGPPTARVMMIGEQPGDKEDLAGRPFVGPAGAVLDKALTAAGIDRNDVYVTNIVKHFKWEPRGKRRIHKRPNTGEISACLMWLEAEIHAVKPQIIVLLGATAAQGILGSKFRVTQRRGEWLTSGRLEFKPMPSMMATVHPSSILRTPDEDSCREEMTRFVDDLKKVAAAIRQQQKAA